MSVGFFKDTNSVHSVLVSGLELGVYGALTLEIHLTEHVQGRLLAGTGGSGTTLLLQGASQLPAILVTLEAEGLAVLNFRRC